MLLFVGLLSALIPILNFIDFLLGPAGDKVLRNFLVASWVALQGDWRVIYQSPADATYKFLRHAIGNTWVTSVYRIFFYTTFFVIMVTIGLDVLFKITANPELDRFGVSAEEFFNLNYWKSKITQQLLPNFIGDYISWLLAVVLFRMTSTAGYMKAVGTIVLAVLAAAFSIFAVAGLRYFDNLLFTALDEHGYPAYGLNAALSAFTKPSNTLQGIYHVATEYKFYIPRKPIGVQTHPWHSIGNDPIDPTPLEMTGIEEDYGFLPIFTTMPLCIFIFSVMIGLIMLPLKPLIRRPLMLILERTEASSKPILTLTAVFLIGLAAFVKAIH